MLCRCWPNIHFPLFLTNRTLILLESMCQAKNSTFHSPLQTGEAIKQCWPIRCRKTLLGGASKEAVVLLIEKVHYAADRSWWSFTPLLLSPSCLEHRHGYNAWNGRAILRA